MIFRAKSNRAQGDEKPPTYLEEVEVLRRKALNYCGKAPELDSTSGTQLKDLVKEAQKLYSRYFYFSMAVPQLQSEPITDSVNGIRRTSVFRWGTRKQHQARKDDMSSSVNSHREPTNVNVIQFASEALTRELDLSRWASQCLAHFAFYTDLLYKLKRFHKGSSVVFPQHPEATQFLSLTTSGNKADVRGMAEARVILAELNDLSSESTSEFTSIVYEWAIQRSKELTETKVPMSPELAIMNACLSYWISILKDNGDQELSAIWASSSWFPVGGNSDEQRQSILIYLKVADGTKTEGGYVAAQDREYVLSISDTDMSRYILITNKLGCIVVLNDGHTEIEWNLNVPNSILMSETELLIYVTVNCSGPKSPPIHGRFKLMVSNKEDASPDVSRCRDDEFGLDQLNHDSNRATQTQEQILFDALSKAVHQAFAVENPDRLNELGVLIDARCGRFLREAVASQIDLAKELIKRTVAVIIQDGWWYISRPQIETAIEQLVSSDQNSGINPLVDQYIESCFHKSSIICSGLSHMHAKLVLLEVWDLRDEYKEITIPVVVNKSLRSKHDQLGRDSVNIPGILNELVRSGLLIESKGRYQFANGFVKSWVQRQYI